jgi:4-O-beta-D-mannosyl-D-glucose phosphorylase
MNIFEKRLKQIQSQHQALLARKNVPIDSGNGIYERYQFPVLTSAHAPVFWEYDLDPDTNPFFMKRFGINATFNAGAILLNGRYLVVARVESYDRKSFFAVAESPNGIDNFRFWNEPLHMPETHEPDGNVYDMRLTQHEDGYIYGVFCTERKDPNADPGDESAAIAQCGIARTHDLKHWQRLSDLKTKSPQQRNVVLHPEFVKGKYAFYTRPQDGFIEAGKGGGIAMGLASRIEEAEIDLEEIVDPKHYHTISELKNGQGPAPLKTKDGWLHLAHGVRQTAAGLRYVLYLFLTDLDNPGKVTRKPAGYFLAPQGDECVGDVSNVVFCNGWILNDNDDVFIYYASSDSRLHVTTSTLERLLDYVHNTPADGFSAASTRKTLQNLIEKNLAYLDKMSPLIR